ncbi:hypothetical protein N7486_005059 [Penicillium sp. IBT 16267x]|nr:hypothetical protein N7486_005059 [Penicillium sp. IBT 16267x]
MDDSSTVNDLDKEFDLLGGYIEPNDLISGPDDPIFGPDDLLSDLLSEPDTVAQFSPLQDELQDDTPVEGQRFESEQEAIQYLQQWALSTGHSLARRRSVKDQYGRRCVTPTVDVEARRA